MAPSMGASPSRPGGSCSKLTTLTSTMSPLHSVDNLAGYSIRKIAQGAMLLSDRCMVAEDHTEAPHAGFRAAGGRPGPDGARHGLCFCFSYRPRSEEHTSELQSRPHLVCR